MSLRALTVGLVVLGGLFLALEGLWPAADQPSWLRRRDLRTDLAYWFFTPLVTRTLTRVLTIAIVVLVALGAGIPLDRSHLEAALFPRSRGVGALEQVLIVVVVGDLIGYFVHRLFHARALWPFHAIHHSSSKLDWLSSVRLHPVNDVLSRVLQLIPFLVLGFDPRVVGAYLPFLTLHAIFLHSNVGWTFGPLRYLVSSPTFHRWHHTTEAEGLDRNFAGLFPWIDLAFGTYYMPRGRRPEVFGIVGETVPAGLVPQLLYPFRGRRPDPPRLPG